MSDVIVTELLLCYIRRSDLGDIYQKSNRIFRNTF